MSQIIRRTFEAAKFPKGSPERAKLNCDWRTSEYMPSYRYGLDDDHKQFRTKTEAENYLKAKGEAV